MILHTLSHLDSRKLIQHAATGVRILKYTRIKQVRKYSVSRLLL